MSALTTPFCSEAMTNNREKKDAAIKIRVNAATKAWARLLASQDDLDESDIIRRAIKFYRAHGCPRVF